MTLAPIVLFVYNRPAHTRQTVEALQQNELAGASELIIYSDAPKKPEAAGAVREVREFIKTITGFKSVTILERETNIGLARSIIEGVTKLCDDHERVIVLEDDLETSPYFLRFMNDALAFYENTNEVMHISGCRYPVEQFGSDETFFLHVPLCWGWATWKRAWSAFEKDISIMDRFDDERVKHFNFGNTYPYWEQLVLNRSGKQNTWFIFWYACVFLRGGLSLFPSRSLVNNVGMDGSGIHSQRTADYLVEISTAPVNVREIPLAESQIGFEKHVRYFNTLKFTKPNLMKRIIRKARSLSSQFIS
jgi:hypothetical protein